MTGLQAFAKIRLTAKIFFILMIGLAGFSAAQAAGSSQNAPLDLTIGKGEIIALPAPAMSVLIADPSIADVQTPSPRQVFLFGRASGSTTLYVLDRNDKVLFTRTVRVQINVSQINDALHASFPQYNLSLDPAPKSLIVRGNVDSANDASDVMKTVEQFVSENDKPINRLVVTTPTQVNLRVRFVTLSRSLTQEFGINWSTLLSSGSRFSTFLYNGRQFVDTSTNKFILSSTGAFSVGGTWKTTANTGLEAMIDALDQEGLTSTLAEPNLTALSGQTASLLAGGEFPIPIVNSTGGTTASSITIEFKQFGVSLSFTPTVLSRDRINLHVRPEVSKLDAAAGITIDGTSVPGLDVSRMETTVELGSGQSFALAGLLQSDISDAITKFPGLGSIPILGRLFSSTSFQKGESELVVLVTPYVVHPSNVALTTPLDALRPVSDIEYVVAHEKDPSSSANDTNNGEPRLYGTAGFIY